MHRVRSEPYRISSRNITFPYRKAYRFPFLCKSALLTAAKFLLFKKSRPLLFLNANCGIFSRFPYITVRKRKTVPNIITLRFALTRELKQKIVFQKIDHCTESKNGTVRYKIRTPYCTIFFIFQISYFELILVATKLKYTSNYGNISKKLDLVGKKIK